MKNWSLRDFERRQRYYLNRQNKFYKANMREYRKEAIKYPTKAESLVKDYLTAQNKEFEFQKIIAINEDRSYRVDFFLPSIMTVLEIDGEYHNEQKQLKLDKEREDLMKRMGLRFVRMTNDDVIAKRYPKIIF